MASSSFTKSGNVVAPSASANSRFSPLALRNTDENVFCYFWNVQNSTLLSASPSSPLLPCPGFYRGLTLAPVKERKLNRNHISHYHSLVSKNTLSHLFTAKLFHIVQTNRCGAIFGTIIHNDNLMERDEKALEIVQFYLVWRWACLKKFQTFIKHLQGRVIKTHCLKRHMIIFNCDLG